MYAQEPWLSIGSEEKDPRQILTGSEIEPKNLYLLRAGIDDDSIVLLLAFSCEDVFDSLDCMIDSSRAAEFVECMHLREDDV